MRLLKFNEKVETYTKENIDYDSTISLLSSEGKTINCNNPIQKTIRLLKLGKIIAIKGLGGFHLSCDAKNEKIIEELRIRKKRPHKPFAIMVKDIAAAKELCFINESEEKALISNKRPIVLLRKKETGVLPDSVAPNMKKLGIMLPYTPLHYLLFQKGILFLIMTSGNKAGTPIQYIDHEAVENLKGIADYYLIHNQNINSPIEDSVVRVINDKEIAVRRGRGYSPLIFPMAVNNDILALGAELKNTFCLSQNKYGYLSKYFGDLKDFDIYTIFEKDINNLMTLLKFKPRLIVHDLNPCFLSSKYAQEKEVKKVSVQHHHAHMVSCMVEHNLFQPVIGVIFDGTGVGTDGKIWGGEFFVGTRESVIRVGHFKYVKIQGGDQSIKEPWRVAISYLNSLNYDFENIMKGLDSDSVKKVEQALRMNINCYETSSLGRLFDCVAALLNIRYKITYEAQAAIELENILDFTIDDDYEFNIEEQKEMYEIDYKGIILGILKDIENAVPSSIISAKFHNTIGNITVNLVAKIKEREGIKNVVLSGGVFENNYLLTYILKRLEEKDFLVYFNQQIPTNDSGISVGQLAIADFLEGKG